MMAQWIDFKKLRDDLDYLDVFSHYGIQTASSNGHQHQISCPFHDDDKPSCGVNAGTKLFNCFGCGESGNILDFVALMEGYDPDDPKELRQAAVKVMADFGIKHVPAKGRRGRNRSKSAEKSSERRKTPSQSVRNGRNDQSEASDAMDEAEASEAAQDKKAEYNMPFEHDLVLSTDHPFLKKRKQSKKLIELFGIGFCNRGMMKGRICFPLHDDQGVKIGYAGRWAGDDVPEDEGKYKLPSNVKKSKILFNLHRVTPVLDGTIVLVEGYWSVMRLWDNCIPVVSTMGHSISEDQVELLRELQVETAIVILDGDDAGRKAAPGVVEQLSRHMFVKQVVLDEGVKPDTMSQDLVSALPSFEGKG